MARKVFISVLGTNAYLETRYYFGEQPTGNETATHFIQEATMQHLCKDWTADDAAYIFVTDKAKQLNWNDPPAQKNIAHSAGYKGLSKIIEDYHFKFNTEAVTIPEGLSEDEIWRIFEIVFEKLEDEDELYFDITHSFRSIPMLMMVLINYAKLLKKIKVKKIYYGAFEKLGPAFQVKNLPVEKRFAPILDITSFSILQDWTNAANDFVSYGNTDKLTALLLKDIAPLAKEYKGQNETVNGLRNISKNLPEFVNNIKTCRGKKIISNTEGFIINQELDKIYENFISPFTPILSQIKNKLLPFKDRKQLINGFHAVAWCIDNHLVQQGFTILQENIISMVCQEVGLDIENKTNRNIASSCFAIKASSIPETKWKNDASENKDITYKILDNSKILTSINKEYSELTQIRNDINHFGYSDHSSDANKLEQKLKVLFNSILQKLELKEEQTTDNDP